MRRGAREKDWLAVGFKKFKHRHGKTAYSETAGVWRDVGGMRTFVTGSCMFAFPGQNGDCHVIIAQKIEADANLQAACIFADADVATIELVFNEPADAYAALCLPGFETR